MRNNDRLSGDRRRDRLASLSPSLNLNHKNASAAMYVGRR